MFTRALGTGTTGFEGQWRFLADLQGIPTNAAARHPSADLLPVFNASYRALREWVTSLGYTQFIARGTTTSLPTTAVEVGENYAIVANAQGLEQIKRVDVKFSGTDWYELPEVTLLQLRDITPSRSTTTPNRPMGWCWLNAGTVAAAAYTAGQIAFAPVPNGGQFCLWTMTEFTDLVNTTDVWLYHTEDWAQWHMWDAMSKVLGARDKDTAGKLDYILNNRLNPNVPGSPAYNIMCQKPTAAGPRTWVRGSNYRGVGFGR